MSTRADPSRNCKRKPLEPPPPMIVPSMDRAERRRLARIAQKRGYTSLRLTPWARGEGIGHAIVAARCEIPSGGHAHVIDVPPLPREITSRHDAVVGGRAFARALVHRATAEGWADGSCLLHFEGLGSEGPLALVGTEVVRYYLLGMLIDNPAAIYRLLVNEGACGWAMPGLAGWVITTCVALHLVRPDGGPNTSSAGGAREILLGTPTAEQADPRSADVLRRMRADTDARTAEVVALLEAGPPAPEPLPEPACAAL